MVTQGRKASVSSSPLVKMMAHCFIFTVDSPIGQEHTKPHEGDSLAFARWRG
jgi:hypothetical protein